MTKTPLLLLVLVACGSGLGTKPRVPVVTDGRSAFDANNDGYADLLLVDASPVGFALVLGGPDGPSTTYAATAPTQYMSFPAATWLGDVNDDGFADYAVYDRSADAPRTYVFFGSDNPVAPFVPDLASAAVSPGTVITDELRVSYAGDLTGDGIPELVIWAYGDQQQGDGYRSYLSIHQGGSGNFFSPVVIHAGNSSLGTQFTAPVPAGDLDGDGFDDLIFPYEPTWNFGAGQIGVLYGGDSLNSLRSGNLSDLVPAQDPIAYTRTWSTGDLRGDGRRQLVREPQLNERAPDASLVGFSAYRDGLGQLAVLPVPGTTDLWTELPTPLLARTVGDVNADGFDDVVGVASGAFSYDLESELSWENYDDDEGPERWWLAGKLVWYGQPEGAVPEPLQVHRVPSSLATTTNGNLQVWGQALAGAGDVNGDGFDDVLIADLYGWNLFYGSNQGIPVEPDLRLTPAFFATISPWVGAGELR